MSPDYSEIMPQLLRMHAKTTNAVESKAKGMQIRMYIASMYFLGKFEKHLAANTLRLILDRDFIGWHYACLFLYLFVGIIVYLFFLYMFIIL